MGLVDPLVTLNAGRKSAIMIRVALFQVISDRLSHAPWYLSACGTIEKTQLSDLPLGGGEQQIRIEVPQLFVRLTFCRCLLENKGERW